MNPQACTILKLDEDAFVERFRPVPNHLDADCGFALDTGGCLFATNGDELQHVLAQDPRTVWTLVEADGRLFIESGLHIVNRLGYLVTEEPVDDDTVYTVALDYDFE